MKTTSLARSLMTGALRAALLCALVGAGWSVYRQLPDDARTIETGDGRASDDLAEEGGETRLRIVLRVETNERDSSVNSEEASGIELYSIDVASAQREFDSERRVGARIEDFIRQRMNGRAPLRARLDPRGEATITLQSGRWWIHATHTHTGSAQELTWRLPVRVRGREQTIELTPDNAYMRTQSF